jgi:hypothetical protein
MVDWLGRLRSYIKKGGGPAIILGLGCSSLIAYAIWGNGMGEWFFQNRFLWLGVLLGVLTGAAEVIARYRDEPFAATFSLPGLSYLTLNGVISGAAYCLLETYKDRIFPGMTDDLMRSIMAGFGAMVIMRSKLFNFKTERGEEYAIGPDAVLSTFLSSVDRKIDRFRSLKRQRVVFEKMSVIADAVSAPDFLRTSLASYQNLGQAEKRELVAAMDALIADAKLNPRLKLMAIGFGLLNVCGETNFSDVMDLLKKYQGLP